MARKPAGLQPCEDLSGVCGGRDDVMERLDRRWEEQMAKRFGGGGSREPQPFHGIPVGKNAWVITYPNKKLDGGVVRYTHSLPLIDR